MYRAGIERNLLLLNNFVLCPACLWHNQLALVLDNVPYLLLMGIGIYLPWRHWSYLGEGRV